MNVMKHYVRKFRRFEVIFWVSAKCWQFGVTRFTSSLSTIRAIYDFGPFSFVFHERI